MKETEAGTEAARNYFQKTSEKHVGKDVESMLAGNAKVESGVRNSSKNKSVALRFCIWIQGLF